MNLSSTLRRTVLLLALAGLPLGAAQDTPPAAASRTYFQLDGTYRPGWFVCDGLDAPAVYAVGQPDANGRALVATFSKARPGEYSYRAYMVGRADPGAGNVVYPLTARDGRPGTGGLRAFNPGVLAQPERALTPTFTSVTLNGAAVSCRWLLGTRLLGYSSRRSVLVTEAPGGGLTYESFDFKTAAPLVESAEAQQSTVPSLRVSGGVRRLLGEGELFTFENAGYTYTVRVARAGGAPGASLTVSRGGRVLQTERLTGYTYAPAGGG